MTRTVLLTTIAVALVLGGALAYQTVARDRDYGALLARGDAALADDQTFGAIEAYSGAIALRPDSTIAHIRRGETYRRRGDLTAAARDFRDAASLDRSAVRPLEELGDVLYQQQKYALAADAYERCLHLDDRQPHVSYKLALTRYRGANVAGAIAAATTALRLDDRLAEAHYLLAVCLREQQKPADAIKELERALALAPNMVAAREELVDLLNATGRASDELEQLQLLATVDRDRSDRQVAAGLAQARLGHPDVAVLTLSNAVERMPDQRIYAALGRVWLDIARTRGDAVALSKAIEALRRVAGNAAATSDTLVLYGRALAEAGQYDTAEYVLDDATHRLPVEPGAFLQHAAVAERQNHFDAARRSLIAYESLVRADADLAAHTLQIATMSLRLNDPRTAVHWLERALRATPHDLRLLTTLAGAQARAGDLHAAQATAQRALDRDPDNAAMQALLRRVR